MAYSAKHLKESLGQGEDMERDEERVEPHISGVRNLSETAREMRAAGRKLVNEDDDKEKDIDDYDRLSGAVKKLQESVDAQRAEVAQTVKRMGLQDGGVHGGAGDGDPADDIRVDVLPVIPIDRRKPIAVLHRGLGGRVWRGRCMRRLPAIEEEGEHRCGAQQEDS